MKKGFTLIELLVVVALIAIVSTLAVNRIGNTKKNASRKVWLKELTVCGGICIAAAALLLLF